MTKDYGSIGYLIDDGAELWMGCHNPRCQRSIRMDLEKMAARFGRDQSTLKHELKKVYPFHCKRCKSMEWQLTHISGSVVRLGNAMKEQQRMMTERLQKTNEASSKALQE